MLHSGAHKGAIDKKGKIVGCAVGARQHRAWPSGPSPLRRLSVVCLLDAVSCQGVQRVFKIPVARSIAANDDVDFQHVRLRLWTEKQAGGLAAYDGRTGGAQGAARNAEIGSSNPFIPTKKMGYGMFP
jgi:hypothetical protein